MNRRKGNVSIDKSLSQRRQAEFFEEVYKTYFDRLYGFALVITKSENLAKDVVSDVFFNLWNAKTDLFLIKELKSYLFTSVKNQAVRALSVDPVNFQNESYEQITNSIDKVSPEDLLVGKELSEFLEEVIQKLPPQCGLVFRMIKEENLKHEEVAAQLGISPETVKYHIKTALKKIKLELEGYFTEKPVIKWMSSGSWALLLAGVSLQIIQ